MGAWILCALGSQGGEPAAGRRTALRGRLAGQRGRCWCGVFPCSLSLLATSLRDVTVPYSTSPPCCTRPLRAAAPGIFAGLCELFELYLLHVFITFSDVSIAELQAAAAQQHSAAAAGHPGGGSSVAFSSGGRGAAGEAALSPRLRATLLRIAGESIGKYRQLFAAQSGSRLARALGTGAAPAAAPAAAAVGAAAGPPASGPAHGSSIASQYFRRTQASPSLPAGGVSPPLVPGVGPAVAAHPSAAGAAAGAAGMAGGGMPSPAPAVEISAVSNAGNLYGLQERITAVECLLAVVAQLQQARGAFSQALPPGEGAVLDSFFSRTVGAAEDLRDFVVGTGAGCSVDAMCAHGGGAGTTRLAWHRLCSCRALCAHLTPPHLPPHRLCQACACCCRCAGCRSAWVPLTGCLGSRPQSTGLGWMTWAASWSCSVTGWHRCADATGSGSLWWRWVAAMRAVGAVV